MSTQTNTDWPLGKCTVPGCQNEAEFDAPRIWCSRHWYMWWDWPEDWDVEEPEWFPDFDEEIRDVKRQT